ncbi:MAG TPA: hypothetical protein VH599_12215 [Ktedonobacterales bacterium]
MTQLRRPGVTNITCDWSGSDFENALPYLGFHQLSGVTCSAAFQAATASPWRAFALQASGPAGQRWPPGRRRYQ